MEFVTIENYLKALYHLSDGNKWMVSNGQLADRLNVIPATITEGIKKLHNKGYIDYEKSYGSKLTAKGLKVALTVIRRHRLWETFLVKELDFTWDEVHDIAEELEHIDNVKLISRLSQKLGNPSHDPHGDPIPDEKGKLSKDGFITLDKVKKHGKFRLSGVRNHTPAFLKYCDKQGLTIGRSFTISAIEDFDGSYTILLGSQTIVVTKETAGYLVLSKQ